MWRQTLQELFATRGCDNLKRHHAQQLKLYRGALTGNALHWFNAAHEQQTTIDAARVEAPAADGGRGRAPQIPDPQRGPAVVLAQALNELALRVFLQREDAIIIKSTT